MVDSRILSGQFKWLNLSRSELGCYLRNVNVQVLVFLNDAIITYDDGPVLLTTRGHSIKAHYRRYGEMEFIRECCFTAGLASRLPLLRRQHSVPENFVETISGTSGVIRLECDAFVSSDGDVGQGNGSF